MDENDEGLSPVPGFGISGVESSGSATMELGKFWQRINSVCIL
jgi:hypothetical protein